MKKIILFLAILSALQLNVFAAIPHLINYQGKLTDTSNNPLTGTYAITFKIYDAETAGNLLWEETQAGVVIQKGIFSVLLGSVANLGLAFDKPYFLEIKVGNEVMTPRQRITSAGYAFKAEQADQATNATTVANVGVSATPSANKLLPLDANAKLPIAALKVYDSGWFAVTKGSGYNLTHNLNTTRFLSILQFSENANGANAWVCGSLVNSHSAPDHKVGSFVKNITPNGVRVVCGASAITEKHDDNGNWYTWAESGYLRLILIALE
jgi:hypothetical protein